MLNKKTKTTTAKTDSASVDKATAALGEQPSKADVRRALGKPVDGAPVAGRLGAGGKTKERPMIQIALPKLALARLYVTGQPGSPLIIHAWGRKAIREMLGKHMGHDIPQANKEPFEDFVDTLYRDPRTGEMAVRSVMFKASMLSALRETSGVTRADAITGISVLGELSPIYGQPTNRLDPVKIGPWDNRVSDLRFRAEYLDWVAVLTFRYNPAAISLEAIHNLLAIAGSLYGVGEWRPTRNGVNGLFSVIDEAEALVRMETLGRWKVSDLTPDNSGTTAILEEYGLDAAALARLKAAPRSVLDATVLGDNGNPGNVAHVNGTVGANGKSDHR